MLYHWLYGGNCLYWCKCVCVSVFGLRTGVSVCVLVCMVYVLMCCVLVWCLLVLVCGGGG